MNCTVCGTQLTGGLDTYGDIDAPVCMEHFFAPPAPTEDEAAIAELEEELDDLDEEIQELEGQLDDLKSRVWRKEQELEKLRPAKPPTKVVLKIGRTA